jgi:hypothetical protein
MCSKVVALLRLPGTGHRTLVSAETAALGERMGEFKRLNAEAPGSSGTEFCVTRLDVDAEVLAEGLG